MIRHMVLIRFKPEISQAELERVFEGFKRMVGTFDGLVAYSGGPYSSPEGINRGYNWGFSMDFRDAAARDRYLPSPEHMEVAGGIGDLLAGSFEESVVAFDYEF
jgi:hypothetical protein